MTIALTRAVSPRISECEVTFRERVPIDLRRAAAEHELYERWLEAHGCAIAHVEPGPEFPDGVFVEDLAVVLDEIALLMRPGAPSRRPERETAARALQRYRPLARIEAPACIEGGDVLRIGRTLYVGRSQRTDEAGIEQLQALVGPFGYSVVKVPVEKCLHLKSAVTEVAEGILLLNPEWIHPFSDLETISVDASEPHAANALTIGKTILMSASHPRTRRALERRGLHVETIDLDELEKAEAGVTCCSVIIPDVT